MCVQRNESLEVVVVSGEGDVDTAGFEIRPQSQQRWIGVKYSRTPSGFVVHAEQSQRVAGAFAVLFALTAIVDLLPTDWRNEIIEYLPANAGSQILTTVPTHTTLGPWAGLGVLCYAAVPILAATPLVHRRDVWREHLNPRCAPAALPCLERTE